MNSTAEYQSKADDAGDELTDEQAGRLLELVNRCMLPGVADEEKDQRRAILQEQLAQELTDADDPLAKIWAHAAAKGYYKKDAKYRVLLDLLIKWVDQADAEHRLPEFENLMPLGIGSFGIAYKATQQFATNRRTVAVKLPYVSPQKRRQASGDTVPPQERSLLASIRCFIDEVGKLIALPADLPHCVRIYDASLPVSKNIDAILLHLLDKPICFWMQYIAGENLRQRMQDDYQPGKSIQTATLVRWMEQIARALQRLHEFKSEQYPSGIIHKDLKPENLLLDADDKPWLTDFGLATNRLGQSVFGNPSSGTPMYMAPEQWEEKGPNYANAQTDIWAWGSIFYELLTGSTPFVGTVAELREQVLNTSPDSPRVRADVPANLARVIMKCLKRERAGRDGRYQSFRDVLADLEGIRQQYVPNGPPPRKPKVSLSHLPVTGEHLVGRARELRQLSSAWRSESTNVVTVVAWGGVGKSALVNHWLGRLAQDNYRGAERIFGWSFYRQGLKGNTASADDFFDAAMRWFGETLPPSGTAWSKGERLADLVRAKRTLVVLDGLEPLQNPPGPAEGRLRDIAMRSFLREMAIESSGLCIVTSRCELPDIADIGSKSAKNIELEQLSRKDGAQLLRDFGLTSPKDDDFMDASEEFGGHCLALTLLGSFLLEGYGGDLRKRDLIPGLDSDPRLGGHVKRVMKSYEEWFGDSAEVEFLKILSLFDRDADPNALNALTGGPPIAGLTDRFSSISARDYQIVLSRLRRANLIADANVARPGCVDAHPLIRDYFSSQLRSENLAAWRAGNDRLFSHLCRLAPEQPKTISDVSLICSGIIHACEAGKHREAFHDLFTTRLTRAMIGNSNVTDVLGTHSLNIGALAHFYEEPWAKLVSGLPLTDRADLYNSSSFCLKTLGRLRESLEPARLAVEAYKELKDWSRATGASSSLLYSMLWSGDISGAIDVARDGVRYSDKERPGTRRLRSRTALGDVLHHAGKTDEARHVFQSAEELYLRRNEHNQLISLESYRFCEFLITDGQPDIAFARTTKSLPIATRNRMRPFEIGLHNLVLGTALLEMGRLTEARHHLDIAVNKIRVSRRDDTIPTAIIRRAKLHCNEGRLNDAQKDLDEALQISIRGEMRLHEADALLELANLNLTRNDMGEFSCCLTQAALLIREMGYGRRISRLTELEALA